MDNASITLNTSATAEGNTDTAELFTKGEFREHKGAFYVDYDESEATGYAGSHVQLCIDADKMTMTRTGKYFSSLVFERGKRHFCHYGTEYGDCMIGISTVQLDNNITAKGGRLHLKYTIDINGGLVTENEITLKVRL